MATGKGALLFPVFSILLGVMNAKLLERMVRYREKHGFSCSQIILSKKIKYQFKIVGQSQSSHSFLEEIKTAHSVQELLLTDTFGNDTLHQYR